jgi:hypothetical protein
MAVMFWAVYLFASGIFTPIDAGGMVFSNRQICENSIARASLLPSQVLSRH